MNGKTAGCNNSRRSEFSSFHPILLSRCREIQRQFCGCGTDDAQYIVHLIHTPSDLTGHSVAKA